MFLLTELYMCREGEYKNASLGYNYAQTGNAEILNLYL